MPNFYGICIFKAGWIRSIVAGGCNSCCTSCYSFSGYFMTLFEVAAAERKFYFHLHKVMKLLLEPLQKSCKSTVELNSSSMVLWLACSPQVLGLDHGFKPLSGQTKDYKIGCFSAKHAALRRKSKDWLARNQDNMSWEVMFQWPSTIKSNSACWSSTKWTSSSSHWKLACSHHDIAEKLLNWCYTTNTHSLTNWWQYLCHIFEHRVIN